jgi:hypothetical protein
MMGLTDLPVAWQLADVRHGVIEESQSESAAWPCWVFVPMLAGHGFKMVKAFAALGDEFRYPIVDNLSGWSSSAQPSLTVS